MNPRERRCLAPTAGAAEAHTRAWRDGRLVGEGFDPAEISEQLASGAVVWLDLLQPSASDMDVVVEELGLHPLAIEDALHAHQRPKLDRYADHLFLAAYAAFRQPDGDVETAEVAAFLTPRALVTVRKDPRIDLAPVLERWDALHALTGSGVGYLVHGVVDVLVDGYVALAQDLDDDSDELEDALFSESGTTELQRRTFEVRSAVTHLRRVVLPMREVVVQLRRPDLGMVDEHLAPYLRDVEDHVQRVLESVEATREQLATALDTTLALQGQRLNETVFRLTAWAALLAVTTAITGYFGQNIPYPGIEQESGFWASTVLLVVSVVALFVWFRRKGWL